MKKSALSEKIGVQQPNYVSSLVSSKIQEFRKKDIAASDLVLDILKQNKTALSRAITIVESNNVMHLPKAKKIISACLPHANKSIRIGITGVPGVGKSTFIEVFGKHLTSIGKKVAVLAIDPSSSISHGSILGDKTRMEELVKDPNAFIRPSATGQTLGGVARKTRESIILCEAAGFDTILIETVGVGQSETAVHGMVDFFLLLNLAGAGDGLQGIKRGIMEMADFIVINKADGKNLTNAKLAASELNRALHYFAIKKSGWIPTATICSAIENFGIDNIWNTILKYVEITKNNNFFENNRSQQNLTWMMETINEQIKNNFFNKPEIISMLETKKIAIFNDLESPFDAATDLLNQYFVL